MRIYIKEKALQDESGSGFMFREGTLTALNHICGSGHELVLDESGLSDGQTKLLEQEKIRFSKPSGKEVLEVDAEKGQLLLRRNSEKEASFGNWKDAIPYLTGEVRKAGLERKTSETDISVEINLDGTGQSNIQTGLNFFDHMLEQIARHGLMDLKLKCEGDLEVDEHHTIEDVAIALGEVILKALGDKKGIERYGFVLPMDEARAMVALDLSGRPYLVFEGEFNREYVGDFPAEMVKHFFYSLAMNLKATIHVSFSGENDHHKIEACFKGFARSLKAAVEKNPRIKNQIPSSKGTL